MAGWIAAARLNLIDGAFDQLAMTEQLVDVPRIVGRQAVEDLTWAAGSVGGKVAALGTISSRGESHNSQSATHFSSYSRWRAECPAKNNEGGGFFTGPPGRSLKITERTSQQP